MMYASGAGQLLALAIAVICYYPITYIALKLAQQRDRALANSPKWVQRAFACKERMATFDSMVTNILATLDTITPGIITRIVARIKSKLPSAAPPNTDPELGGGETALAEFEDSKVAGHTLFGYVGEEGSVVE